MPTNTALRPIHPYDIAESVTNCATTSASHGVLYEISLMDKQLAEFSEVLNALDERLAPVMLGPGSISSGDKEQEEPRSSISAHLHEQNRGLAILLSHLQNTLSQIDL